MKDVWIESQNSSEALIAVAASDTLWCRVQQMRAIQLSLVVGLPVLVSTAAVLAPKLQVAAAYFGFVMSIADVFINNAIARTRREAAQMQDRFDSIAMHLPRVRFRTQDDPDIARIAELARRQPLRRAKRNRDWYTPLLGALPISFGRLACMRESVHWDSSVRRGWSAAVCCIALLAILGLVSWAVLDQRPMDDFFMSVVAPLAPALIWSTREWKEQADSAATYDSLRVKLRAIWDSAIAKTMPGEELEAAASEVAWALLNFRASASPVPDAVYRIQRRTRSESASDAARLLIREFEARR